MRPGLDDGDHVLVGAQVRRQLVEVGQHPVLGGVVAVGGGGVGEAEDHLQPGRAHGVELLLQLVERGLAIGPFLYSAR